MLKLSRIFLRHVWWKRAVRRNSKILERRRKKSKKLRRDLKFLQLDAVNAGWNYTGNMQKGLTLFWFLW